MELIMLGGAQEIGANSCYLGLDGTGVIIDAGLHPRRKDKTAFPKVEALDDRVTDALILTHSHTDHIGGLPYLLKHHPHLRIICHRGTRDLLPTMLKSTIKILPHKSNLEIPKEDLALYKSSTLDLVANAVEGWRYHEEIDVTGARAMSDISATLYDAGHILGSSSVLVRVAGRPGERDFTILHTGDIQFRDQAIQAKASVPRHHVDVLIIESTNGASDHVNDYSTESVRLAEFINQISNSNGSILIPSFALGKTQEILKVCHNLMQKGLIPHMPLYSGGMGKTISNIYDRFCYSVNRVDPGFEVGDIPQVPVSYDDLNNGGYFSEPSIVVISSGMVYPGTTSYKLSQKWLQLPSYGIALIGWQDPESPGYAIQHSKRNEEFDFAGTKVKRLCHMEKFRFSAHAMRDDLVDFIMDVRPKQLYLVHGDEEACVTMAGIVSERLPETLVRIPELGRSYDIEQTYYEAYDIDSARYEQLK